MPWSSSHTDQSPTLACTVGWACCCGCGCGCACPASSAPASFGAPSPPPGLPCPSASGARPLAARIRAAAAPPFRAWSCRRRPWLPSPSRTGRPPPSAAFSACPRSRARRRRAGRPPRRRRGLPTSATWGSRPACRPGPPRTSDCRTAPAQGSAQASPPGPPSAGPSSPALSSCPRPGQGLACSPGERPPGRPRPGDPGSA
mmetsp:Transcript_118082/g.316683  ORF Transcript_118082/g.316683 Transcript_118082/m.316683 type:complete len:201 (-) Transcript_118082:542-1144(-)